PLRQYPRTAHSRSSSIGRDRRVTRLAAGGIALTVLAAAVAVAQESPDYRTWDQYLGGVDSSQYSALDQINKGNVADLEVAWTYDTGQNHLFNPIVVDGVMYTLGTARATIAALDAATGEEIWTRDHEGGI